MTTKDAAINSSEQRIFMTKLIILAAFIAALFFIYSIANILMILFFALFLNVLFAPFLNTLNRYKISDWLGIIIIYLLLVLFLAIIFFAIIPIFIKQLGILTVQIGDHLNNLKSAYEQRGLDGLNVPAYLQGLLGNIDINELLDTLKGNFKDISFFITNNMKRFLSNGAGLVFNITNAIFHFLLVFLFAFFIALERRKIRGFFYKILPADTSRYILSKEDEIVDTLSQWLKGQAKLGLAMFVLTLIGLLFLRLFGIRINEFFSLALIAGMMEFIPYIGPFIALLPALALATAFGFKGVIAVLVLYVLLQQMENNLLVPFIMSKSLSLSPFAVLFGMAIGASLLGVLGIIIAIPLVSMIQIFLVDYLKKRNKQKI